MAAPADLSELHAQARRLIFELQGEVERLERQEELQSPATAASTSGGSSGETSRRVRAKLQELRRLSQDMDHAWRVLGVRDSSLWKRKVEQTAAECDALTGALEKYVGRQSRRQQEARERQELLQQRLAAEQGGAQVLQQFDLEGQAAASAQRSGSAVEQMVRQGAAILQAYAAQRQRLKSAERRVLDVLNTLGLSNATLRVVERRQLVDKLILFGGMALLVLLTLGLLWLTRRGTGAAAALLFGARGGGGEDAAAAAAAEGGG